MTDQVVIGPRRLRMVCRSLSAVVVVVFTAIAVVLPRGAIHGRQFGLPDQLLFFLTGVGVAAVILGFSRFRVRADRSGVWVHNALAERYFPWGVVEGVSMGPDASWAELLLHDDQRVALLAVQAHDGEHAQRSLDALRSLRPGSGDPSEA